MSSGSSTAESEPFIRGYDQVKFIVAKAASKLRVKTPVSTFEFTAVCSLCARISTSVDELAVYITRSILVIFNSVVLVEWKWQIRSSTYDTIKTMWFI